MNKNLYFKNFGKLFLIMGAVFAITGIGQASAQWIGGAIRCVGWEDVDMSHDHLFTYTVDVSAVKNAMECTNWDGRYCHASYWSNRKDGFGTGSQPRGAMVSRAKFSIPICNAWEINVDSLMPHIIARLPAQANTIINNTSPSTFKAKMLSAIPDADQQFKAKVMTLLPLPELAKYYDPNRIFE